MPDMRTEMMKTIQSWGVNEVQTTEKKTPLGEQIYNWIKVNPDSTIAQVKDVFGKETDSSIATTLKSLYDRGILARISVPRTNYSGIGKKNTFIYNVSTRTYETQNKGYTKVKKPKKVDIKKLIARDYSPPVQRPVAKNEFDAIEFVKTLNLYQAKDVYAALKSVFESRLGL